MKRLTVLAVGLASTIATAAAAAGGGKLSDPQIANVALTAHTIDIARGRMAGKKSKNAEVKQFADQMVKDHSAGKAEAVALAGRLGVKPEPSAVSKSLDQGAAKTARRLRKLKGAAFDRAYIDAEVGYHQAVIDAVKNTLVPGAQNEELKKLLVDAGPTLEGHLAHAKMVQKQLAGR